jgi:hypothetical protein
MTDDSTTWSLRIREGALIAVLLCGFVGRLIARRPW